MEDLALSHVAVILSEIPPLIDLDLYDQYEYEPRECNPFYFEPDYKYLSWSQGLRVFADLVSHFQGKSVPMGRVHKQAFRMLTEFAVERTDFTAEDARWADEQIRRLAATLGTTGLSVSRNATRQCTWDALLEKLTRGWTAPVRISGANASPAFERRLANITNALSYVGRNTLSVATRNTEKGVQVAVTLKYSDEDLVLVRSHPMRRASSFQEIRREIDYGPYVTANGAALWKQAGICKRETTVG